MHSKSLARITPWMQSYIDDGKLAGSSVLIQQGGKEAYFHSVGLRDKTGSAPFDRDTVARIYSMTKPITSFVLMMLVEEGLVHLDAPLSQFIPEFSHFDHANRTLRLPNIASTFDPHLWPKLSIQSRCLGGCNGRGRFVV
jgi:CubicO group peptidase (beta-lactamase class C family)